MYLEQNRAIQSTDKKVLNCHTIEFSFKAQVSIINQEVLRRNPLGNWVIKFYILNFQNFTCVFTITILVKFGVHFLGLPLEIFFGVIAED